MCWYTQNRWFSGSEVLKKPSSYFVKIKFAPDTADDIGRHEWQAGGGQWNNERFLGLTSLHQRNLWMCWKSRRWWAQHPRHFHVYEVTGNQLRPNPLLTQSILKIRESVTRSKVSDQCLSRREAKYPTPPQSSTGRRPSGPDSAALRRIVWLVRPQSLTFWLWKLIKHKRKHPSFSAWIYPSGLKLILYL